MSLTSASERTTRLSASLKPVSKTPAVRPPLPPDVEALIADSYPRNHNYRIKGGKLAPSCRLAVRFRRISALYPQPVSSLLDLSASKGYFVLEAACREGCQRAMGIDVVDETLAAASMVRDHLGLDNARFARMRLDTLAQRIQEFGGPFQTVLLINTYQYMFFGGKEKPFESHEAIFHAMRTVCSGRVIFNNRIELSQVQVNVRKMALESGRAGEYRADLVRAAAEKFFHIEVRGRLCRFPFWVLTPR